MKKLFSITLALALIVLSFMPLANASDTESILIYVKVNDTANAASTNVSTDTIIPGKHRILGYRVNPIISGTGTINVGLYDAATTATALDAVLFGESACANTATEGETFPGPKPLSAGLHINQGAYSSVTVYYERSLP